MPSAAPVPAPVTADEPGELQAATARWDHLRCPGEGCVQGVHGVHGLSQRAGVFLRNLVRLALFWQRVCDSSPNEKQSGYPNPGT